MPERAPTETEARLGAFTTTNWSVVACAGNPDSPQAQAALGRLCQSYWFPLYVFVRRQGHNPEDAKDLVQGFFAKLIEKNYVSGFEHQKGRFRSFLLVALKRYAAKEYASAHRQKRGGAQEVISLDAQDTEMRYRAEPVDELSPEKAYERQWALTLLTRVLDGVAAEYGVAGKSRVFKELKMFLNGERGASYAEVGQTLQMSEGAVKVAVHRLRHRYRELLRLEIAHTVSAEDSIEDELRNLFAAVS